MVASSALRIFPLFPLLPIFLLSTAHQKIDLGDPSPQQNRWHFYSSPGNISMGIAVVPGDIFADLQSNGHIGEPLYGQGDWTYRWVGRQNWTYERPMHLAEKVVNATFVLLQVGGLDGPASVWLNNRHVANVDNQFLSHSLDLKPFVVLGLNTLRISFQSPVVAAAKKADNYRMRNLHALPPECPPPVYNGECHVNQLRKMQASFSWDWAPSFPTLGIWRPIQLEHFDQLSVQTFSPMVQTVGQGNNVNFLVNVSLALRCSTGLTRLAIQLSMPELGLTKHNQIRPQCPQFVLHNLTMFVPGKKVKLWWPRGYGQQPLYRLDLAIYSLENGRHLLDKAQKRIAFRTILLNQNPVNGSDQTQGLLFQFEVNTVPIFLKGTNWVPISSFPARNHSFRRQFLFHSMAEANMNTMRVWGGGVYEQDEFYDLADEFGFLIWHDLMFACALYPNDAAFLRNVQAEVEQQVSRLRHHPSLLCWAGNNENELAIRTKWYPEWNYPEGAQTRDYLSLYKATIQPLVQSMDQSRPFLLSSPSNGEETEKEGGIARNPGDPRFGDVHFYTETRNLWRDENFPVPRCASEFGVQSMPLRGTMLHWMPEEDWRYGSETLVRRQHHPGGILTLPAMIFQHFTYPFWWENRHSGLSKKARLISNGTSFIDEFAFLSQAHQAIALQAQIEHYRRWRSRLDGKGFGRTMCALYWQLNDVWAAPTWSSVDFDLRWKMAHHFARRAFAPLIVSMFLDPSEQLRIFLVSDLTIPVQMVTLSLEMFVFQLGFQPIFSTTMNVPEVPPLSAIEVTVPTAEVGGQQRWRQLGYSEDDYFVIASLADPKSGQLLSPKAVLLPNKMSKVGRYGQAKLVGFKRRINDGEFELTIRANNVLPLVWIDLNDQFKLDHPEVLYNFEENAFAMSTEEQEATLKLFSNPKRVEISQNDIQITLL